MEYFLFSFKISLSDKCYWNDGIDTHKYICVIILCFPWNSQVWYDAFLSIAKSKSMF